MSKTDLSVLELRRKRAEAVGVLLDEYFPDSGPTLKFYSPFTLLTAVVLSAQCRDERVNKVTEELFKVAGTPERMAALSREEIFTYICSLGLAKNKAKFLSEMSRRLVTDFGGQVPDDFAGLESLPGVGHKTASVVMLQAFNKPAFPVDTHIFRLSARWGLSDGKTVERTEADLKELFPIDCWGRRHVQFIDCGRRFCKAVGHKPEECPFCSRLGDLGLLS